MVGLDTLKSIKESLLSARFQNYTPGSKQPEIYIDRDPEVFGHVITYLRSGRQFLPSHVSLDMKKKVEMEIKFWQLDKGLKSVDSLTHPDAQRLSNMLCSFPKTNPQHSTKSIENWKKFKPLTIQDIIDHSPTDFDFDQYNLEFKEVKFPNKINIG